MGQPSQDMGIRIGKSGNGPRKKAGRFSSSTQVFGPIPFSFFFSLGLAGPTAPVTPLSFFFSLELAGPTAPVTPLSFFFSLELAGPTAPVTPLSFFFSLASAPVPRGRPDSQNTRFQVRPHILNIILPLGTKGPRRDRDERAAVCALVTVRQRFVQRPITSRKRDPDCATATYI